MACAKHPLVAPYGSDTAPNLIGQSLKRKTVIGFSQGTRKRNGWTFLRELCQKDVKSFRVAAVEHMLIADIRNSPAFTTNEQSRQVEAMNRIQEKKAANSIVKIFAGPSIPIEF
jgi:hypothetical protein